MKIKEQVFWEISDFIKKEYEKIRADINCNKYEMKNLREEQTILKRKKVELDDLYNYCIKRGELEK